MSRRPSVSWDEWASRPRTTEVKIADLLLQIKRDVAVLDGDPTYHGPTPGRAFYEERVAQCRAEILALEQSC